jgi:glycerol-3-phosphate acyltransferase PlsY
LQVSQFTRLSATWSRNFGFREEERVVPEFRRTLAGPLPLLGALLIRLPVRLDPVRADPDAMAGLGDVRKIGSGNIGATNVLRTGNKKLAAHTAADALKGTVAVLAARQVLGLDAAMIAGLGAFLGHLYPVWLKFKGGKGVATYLGVLARPRSA